MCWLFFIFSLIKINFLFLLKTIDIEPKKFDPFFNINTKEDLEEAKKILKEN